MRFPRTQVRAATLVIVLLNGCGTQIGNPTGSGIVRVTDDTSNLNTLVNAAFLQTVDGMNTGDYAYSKLESRVSDRSCETQASSGISLVDNADFRHSVVDDAPAWNAQSDLTIKRSYQDAWTQNGELLVCEANARVLRFNYERLEQGTVRLESQVDEDLSRSLLLTDKNVNEATQHNLSFRKTGKRTLEFIRFAEMGSDVNLEAQLSNQVESTVALPPETGVESATLQLQEPYPLDFTITLDQSRQWSRYVIPSGRQEFIIPSSGEILRLEFLNVTFTREGGCFPVDGQLAATIVRPNETPVRYSMTFDASSPLIMKQDGGTGTLVLAPFACVLKER